MIPGHGKFIHPTALLVLRFAGDVESDSILAPHSVGLRNRLCARFFREFFEDSMTTKTDIGEKATGNSFTPTRISPHIW